MNIEKNMNDIEEKLESLKESISCLIPGNATVAFQVDLLVDNIENTVSVIKSILDNNTVDESTDK